MASAREMAAGTPIPFPPRRLGAGAVKAAERRAAGTADTAAAAGAAAIHEAAATVAAAATAESAAHGQEHTVPAQRVAATKALAAAGSIRLQLRSRPRAAAASWERVAAAEGGVMVAVLSSPRLAAAS